MSIMASVTQDLRSQALSRQSLTGKEGATRLAGARMAFGVAGMIAPRAFGRAWIGEEGRSGRVALVTRAFAVRDLALGLGLLLAVQRDTPYRGWLEAGLLCDATDTISVAFSPLPRSRRLMLALAALTGVAGGVAALQGLEER